MYEVPSDSNDQFIACWQTYGQQSRVQKYCKFFRRQHMLDKFDSTIQQLDEHSETAWKLQDSDVVMRRRGMRASFTKGPSIYSNPSLSADNVGPRDSMVLDSADCAGNFGLIMACCSNCDKNHWFEYLSDILLQC